MKSFGIFRSFLLLSVLFTLQYSHAQDFLVTTSGDTLYGDVKPLFYGIDKKVQVRGSDKKKTIYPMFKVVAFRFKDEIYQPVKGPDGYTFMKLIKPGYLSLYAYQLPNQANFDGQFLTRKDGTGMDVPNLSFKKFMKNYLEDCPAVVDKIDNGDLGKKELLEIIDEYNQCIADKSFDHGKHIAELEEKKQMIGAWDILEKKVQNHASFDGQQNAIEMIQEIKNKISKSESIPNFLLDGLKGYLNQGSFRDELDAALKEIN
jgi:hypothetical protein